MWNAQTFLSATVIAMGKSPEELTAAQAKRGSLGTRLDSREGGALSSVYSHARAPEIGFNCQMPRSA